MLMSLIQVSLLVFVVGMYDPVTVVVEYDSPLDLSGTHLTTSYCVAKGRECRGDDLVAVFAATPEQCHSRCNRNLKCLLAFYTTTDQMCHERAKRCTTDQLHNSTTGTSYYRLKKGEKCPSGQPAYYVQSSKEYSDSFCLIPEKACPNHNLYPKPQNIQPDAECLKKCAKIKSCAGVDFDGNCSPKSYECSDDELVFKLGTDHYFRLEKGVTTCPCKRLGQPRSTEFPPEPPVCQGEQEVSLMVVGSRVERGCNWDWGEEDGPVGLGTIVELPVRGWVVVKWDAGEEHWYRMGVSCMFDLQLA